jgi:hypothetical protein
MFEHTYAHTMHTRARNQEAEAHDQVTKAIAALRRDVAAEQGDGGDGISANPNHAVEGYTKKWQVFKKRTIKEKRASGGTDLQSIIKAFKAKIKLISELRQAAMDLSACFFEADDAAVRAEISTVLLRLVEEASHRSKELERAELKRRSLWNVDFIKEDENEAKEQDEKIAKVKRWLLTHFDYMDVNTYETMDNMVESFRCLSSV